MRYFIILLFASACASGPSSESSSAKKGDTNPAVTFVLKSENDAPYILSRDQTFEERLQKKPNVDTLSAGRDTFIFPLTKRYNWYMEEFL